MHLKQAHKIYCFQYALLINIRYLSSGLLDTFNNTDITHFHTYMYIQGNTASRQLGGAG